MKVCSLASSSKGNCTIVYNDHQILVVDMGITFKEFEEKLALLKLDINNVIGAIVSHEHGDHIKGLLAFYNKLHLIVISKPCCLVACYIHNIKNSNKKKQFLINKK